MHSALTLEYAAGVLLEESYCIFKTFFMTEPQSHLA